LSEDGLRGKPKGSFMACAAALSKAAAFFVVYTVNFRLAQ